MEEGKQEEVVLEGEELVEEKEYVEEKEEEVGRNRKNWKKRRR